MTSQAAAHKRNLESSILFMQQEHADTLKGLHSEIHKLQKKCTDLTFQLTMHGMSIEESDDTSSKFQDIKKQLEDQSLLIRKQEEKLLEKDEKIKELEHSVKSYKKKYLDESRKQNEIVNRLKADVETKSCTVAYLTSKLHQIKIQTKAESESDGIIKTEVNRVPAPPKEMLSKPRRMANIRRNPASAESVSFPSVRLSSGRSSGSNGSNSPDISHFLPPTKSQEYQREIRRSKPAILPPIASSQDKASVLVHQVVHPKRFHCHKPCTPEIAKLAVEQLPHRTKNWANPQESHSSEYK